MTATAMPGVTGYHHMSVPVTDVDRSEEWYSRVLGFERGFIEKHEGGYAVVMARPPLYIGLHVHDANEGERFGEHRTGLDHFAISVATRAELDAWVDYLDGLSVGHSDINDRNDPFPYATLIIRDADNVQIEQFWMPA